MYRCKCEQVEFTLPNILVTMNRCHCSICKTLSGADTMCFCKIYENIPIRRINQQKYLILSNISKIGLLKSSDIS